MSIPINEQYGHIELSQAQFPSRDRLVRNMAQWSEALYGSGRCMYQIPLTTNRLLEVMMVHVRHVEFKLRRIADSTYWWQSSETETHRIGDVLDMLLNELDDQLVGLLAGIGNCVGVLEQASQASLETEVDAKKGRHEVDELLQRKHEVFRSHEPDPALFHHTETTPRRPKRTLSFGRLLNYRAGLEQLLEQLQGVLRRLSRSSGRIELARTSEKDRSVLQLKKGNFDAPPVL
ncbi:hypothetical protein H2204_003787 [Knufia peltigerae]|uniref:Uncharacterized protein n=1 Tax=Knufia peltigerae TaxID=1002370 RepID=A0AA38Y8D3_9EURO|nr:hypothetical protein H2204_003787 [Knufia peltigerae]